MAIFIPPCHNYYDWQYHLKTSELNEVIKTAVERVESRYRSEDIILSNVSRLIIGSPAHGQLIDSMPSKEGQSASRTAEILIEASTILRQKY